jgi:hypothetical protein
MNIFAAIVCWFIGHNMHGTCCGEVGYCTECGMRTRAAGIYRNTW